MIKASEMIKIADIHANRINLALKELQTLFPLDQDKVANFTTQQLLLIELLVSRFAKLQDFLGKKLINEFFILEEEPIDDLTMLDKINKLERLELIESADFWKEMRDARNHIAHEYPEHPELTALYLNKIFTLAPKLLSFFNTLKHKINSKQV